MAFALHKVARGFLELLNARNLGRSPDTASDQVVPVLEIGEFYASTLIVGNSGSPTVGALADLSEFVQATATMRVKAIGGTLVIGAAAATNVTIHWGIITTNGQQCPVGSIHVAQCLAGGIIGFGCPIPNWVVPPGTFFFARASGTAAGADHSLTSVSIIENYVSGQ